jgi:polyisoprenoid-binding protein YceI
MRSAHVLFGAAAAAAAIAAASVAPVAQAGNAAPLAFASAKVTITGTTNVHGYTASTSTVRVTRAGLASAFTGDLWALVQTPSMLQAFDIAIPAASLKSPKDGIDKNMHKALRVTEFADITFRIQSAEARGDGAVRAHGTLTIAGVEKAIVLDLAAQRAGSNLSVAGEIPLLMTDYGIKPPKAMMGMMRTDPKITVRLELVLTTSGS